MGSEVKVIGGVVGDEVGRGVEERVRMQPVCNEFTFNPGGHKVHADAFALEYCPIGHFVQIFRTRSA